MDAGSFAADFIAANAEKIFRLGKSAYGKLDEALKLKLRNSYDEYLVRMRDKHSKTKSFFIRDQPVDLYSYYVPTGIASSYHSISRPTFEACIDFSNKFVISGTGGTGKSVLMRHLFLDCIRHKKFVPIFIELRELNRNKNTLMRSIYDSLENHGFTLGDDFIKRAMEAGHFCFFFDGYDELDHALRSDVMLEISEMLDRYVSCPVIISSRPDDVFNGGNNFSVFKILPLDLMSASLLVERLPYDEEVKVRFIDELNAGSFVEHESFLSNPLLLSIMLLTYGSSAEIPSKLSIFYNQAYEALFQRHDANKAGYLRMRLTKLDIQDFAKVFSLFSVLTYEKRLFKMSRTTCLDYISKSSGVVSESFKSSDYLADLLSAACLLMEDGLDISFSHRSFQEYFVAYFVSKASSVIQENLIASYWQAGDSDSILSLLYEIHPEVVEKVLIIPKLEDLFRCLGVVDVVEKEHAFKFLQMCYGQILIDDEDMIVYSDITREGDRHVGDVSHFVDDLYNIYKPSDGYYKNLASSLLAKYSPESHTIRVDSKTADIDDPIIISLLDSSVFFSVEFVQNVYDLYKSLKVKHEREFDIFQSLLHS